MTTRITHDDLLRRKRELRMRIGRSRRRIDGRLRASRDRVWQLFSWRTYAVRSTVWVLAVALRAGIAASAGLKRGRASRWLGLSQIRHACGEFLQYVWAELRRMWTNSMHNR